MLPYALRRRRGSGRASLLPKPPPWIVTLTDPFTGFGHSFTAGNISGPTHSYPAVVSTRVVGLVDNEGRGGQTAVQIADRVTDTDPTIYDPTGTGLTRAEQVAGHVVLNMERNDITSAIGVAGTTAAILTQIARAIAALTSDSWAVSADSNADVEPSGLVGWAQIIWIRRELMRLYPTRVIDWKTILARYPARSTVDARNLARDVPPAQTRHQINGTINSAHPGPVGNAAIAYDGILPWLRGEENGGGWVQPYHEVHITGADATTATTPAGAILTVPFRGSIDTCHLTKGDTAKFALDAATGALTCAASFTPTAPYYDLEYEVISGAVRTRGALRLFIGASDTTCSDTRVWGHTMQMPDSPTGIDAKDAAYIFGVKMGPGTDGLSMSLLGSESVNGVRLQRTVSNTLQFTARTSAGTVVVNLNSTGSGAGQVNEAAGWVWIAIAYDLNPGTPVACMLVNGTDVLSASKTLTQGATVLNSVRPIPLASNSNGSTPFNGWLRQMWTGRYVDWTTSALRDEVYNSSTLAAVNLPSDGSVNSVVPWVCLAGNDADRYWGNNIGSAGPFCTVIPTTPVPAAPVAGPPGDFAPTDLGAKLIGWWSPADHGTGNMTDDGSGLISAWKDNLGGLSRTATTTARPTWDDSAINDIAPALVFDGTAAKLSGSTAGSLPASTTPGWIVGLAGNDGLGDGVSRFVYQRGAQGAGGFRRISKSATDTMSFGDGMTTTTGGSLFQHWNAPAIFACHFEATQYTLRANGKQGPATTGATLNTGAVQNTIGASNTNTPANFWKGTIADLFEVADTATLADIQKLEGWLAWTYGTVSTLDPSHPYKNARP